MKKIVLLICIACVQMSSAAIQIGLDFNLTENPNIQTSSSTIPDLVNQTRNTFYFGFEPYVGIFPSQLLEICPTLRFQISSSSTTTEYSGTLDTIIKSSSTQAGLGAGVGFYFHVLRSDFLELALGPAVRALWLFKPSVSTGGTSSDTYSSYYNGAESVDLPVKIDMFFSKHVGARFSARLLGFDYSTHSYKYTNGRDPDVNHNINFYIVTNWTPNIGLFFKF